MSSDSTLVRFVRFCVTGIFNTAVHAAVATAWIHAVQPKPAVANGVAFLVATTLSLLVNTHWSFSAALSPQVVRRYAIVALIGLGCSMGLAGGMEWMGFSYQAGIVAVVLVMPVLNFTLHHFWTYRK
ncbi:MAG: GtrA family protein [Rhodoferax sp.]